MTLPTRANGGINWDKLWPPETVRPEALRLSFIQVGKEAAAHTRERCAKWHDDEALKFRGYLAEADGGDWSHYIGMAEAHEESAAAIRKMED